MGMISSSERDISRIVQSIRELWTGRSNATGQFTLDASATSTTVAAMNCGPTSKILLTPQTAHAAAALATTYIDPDDVTQGQFVVQHANNSQTDRTFAYAIQG